MKQVPDIRLVRTADGRQLLRESQRVLESVATMAASDAPVWDAYRPEIVATLVETRLGIWHEFATRRRHGARISPMSGDGAHWLFRSAAAARRYCAIRAETAAVLDWLIARPEGAAGYAVAPLPSAVAPLPSAARAKGAAIE